MAFAAAALGAVLYVVFLSASKPPEGDYGRFARGSLAKLASLPEPLPQPDHAFLDAAGASRTLADFRGRVLVVNLWATWCAPCREEMPTLAALQQRFEGRGVEIVAISIDTMSARDEAQSMLHDLAGDALDFYIDPSRRMPFAIGAPGLPTTIVFDREGREIARLAGAADWSSAEAVALMEAALAAS